jgi:hypothetical protein
MKINADCISNETIPQQEVRYWFELELIGGFD